MTTLLIVEDDPTIGAALRAALIGSGHDVVWVETGQDALTTARLIGYDLVLLDLGLPDLDGLDVCRQIRTEQTGAVVVILTARDEEVDIVLGLDAGADDYLTKPVRLAELLARIRAHLRRGPTVLGGRPRLLCVGALEIDLSARRVRLAGEELVLRAKEFDLLARLASEPGTTIPRATLMADVWDEHWFGSTKTLDVHLSALRRRLADAAPHSARVPQIVTLRGRGFRLDLADPEPASRHDR